MNDITIWKERKDEDNLQKKMFYENRLKAMQRIREYKQV